VKETLRRAGVSGLALALVLLATPPPVGAADDEGAHAVAMLKVCNGGAAEQHGALQVAQAASPSGSAASETPSPTPSPSPTLPTA